MAVVRTLKTRLRVQSLGGQDLQLLPQGYWQAGTQTATKAFNRSNPAFCSATYGSVRGTSFAVDQFHQADPAIGLFSFLPIPPTQNFVC
jgi:hypothetical protein